MRCLLLGLLVAAWKLISMSAVDLQEISAWLTPHRHAWYALPMVMFAFTVMGLGLLPVMLLIVQDDIWLGVYRIGSMLLHPLALIYAVSGSAMISTLRVPKP